MKKNKNYVLLCVAAFLQGLVFYGPIATIYRVTRGISVYDIFIIESIFMILMVLFQIPWGWFADRYGYKKTLIIAYFLSFASKIVFYKAHTFGYFLLERIMLALSVSGTSGCDSALIYGSVGPKDSAKAFSMYNALSIAGFFVATLSSTFIIPLSLDLTVWLTIIPYGAAFILTFFLAEIKVNGEKRENIISALKYALNNRRT